MRRFVFAVGLFAAFALTPVARGQVVHDNGAFGVPAVSLTQFTIADDFTFLGAPVSFNTVRFWAGGLANEALGYSGTIAWQFLDNGASGHPGNLLASGTASPVAQFVGSDGEFDTYVFEFQIPTLTLFGTNFLALHDGPLSSQEQRNFFWSDVPGAANPNAEEITTPNSPVALRTDFAFQLLAVPEPMSAVLLASGLVFAAACRRPRKR